MKEFKVTFKKSIERKIAGKVMLVARESTKTIIAKTASEAEAKAKRFAGWSGMKVMSIEDWGFCRGM